MRHLLLVRVAPLDVRTQLTHLSSEGALLALELSPTTETAEGELASELEGGVRGERKKRPKATARACSNSVFSSLMVWKI